MKKSARDRIIIWSVVSVILIGVLVAGMMSSALFSFGNIKIGSFEIGRDLSTYERGNAQFSRDKVQKIEINWTAGNVKVIPSSTDEFKIYENVISESEKMYYKLSDNGTLKICDKKEFNFISFGLIDNSAKELTVEIPRQARLNNLEISAASAGIKATDCYVQEMSVNTASGDINLENMSGARLDTNTASGETIAVKCDFSEIDVTAVSGKAEINTYSSCGKFSASSVSGEVVVNFDEVKKNEKLVECNLKDININAVSGNIEVNLPRNIEGFTADLESVSGRKIVNFDGRQNGDKTTYGNGKTKIDLETVSGSIEINRIGERTEHIYE